jgi:hypothetical protein
MDPAVLHTLCSLLSSFAQMCAIIIVIFCAINFFSLKPGKSIKFVFISLIYFFSLTIILLATAQFLLDVSGLLRTMGGVKALIGGSLLHLSFGLLILILYLRIILSEIRMHIS